MKKELIKNLILNEGIDEASRAIEEEFAEMSGKKIAFNIFMFLLGILTGLVFFQFI